MPLTTDDVDIQLLMDSTVNLQEIEARITARAFGAVHSPEQGPAVRQMLARLLEVLDATSPDGVIWARLSAPGNAVSSHHGPMPTDSTSAHDDAAFLALLHHVVFELTDEQAEALMADDEITATDRLLSPEGNAR